MKNDEILKILKDTRMLVAEAASFGFNYKEGDWVEKLYCNNAKLTQAIKSLDSLTYYVYSDGNLHSTYREDEFIKMGGVINGLIRSGHKVAVEHRKDSSQEEILNILFGVMYSLNHDKDLAAKLQKVIDYIRD